MQIIFFIIGIIGLVMFFFGGKILLQKYKSKIIGELKITENEINFEKSGLYSICVVGGGYANNQGNFEAIINNGTELDTIEKDLKFKFRHKGKLPLNLCLSPTCYFGGN